MSCPGCPPPAHEHGEGMNECPICDAPVPCARCGHSALHGTHGCWGRKTSTGLSSEPLCKCKKWVRPTCKECAPGAGRGDAEGAQDNGKEGQP